eukprot:TRINITY_DN9401_c0_g2_i1.p1 TRINITY_DN9401_c0_g2~~TRINITY_DN9401_c0_g2_i1.p1  ORF type:complete len:597 (+),score=102.20 TRINITY_DN9401_c0_g2_i1:43-1833(+)
MSNLRLVIGDRCQTLLRSHHGDLSSLQLICGVKVSNNRWICTVVFHCDRSSDDLLSASFSSLQSLCPMGIEPLCLLSCGDASLFARVLTHFADINSLLSLTIKDHEFTASIVHRDSPNIRENDDVAVELISDSDVATLIEENKVAFRCALRLCVDGTDLQSMQQSAQSQLCSAALRFITSDGICMTVNDDEHNESHEALTCALYQQTPSHEGKGSLKKQHGKAPATTSTVSLSVSSVQALWSQCTPINACQGAVSILYQKPLAKKQMRYLHLHGIGYFDPSTSVKIAFRLLQKKLLQQATELSKLAITSKESEPQFYLYRLPQIPHYMCAAYPSVPQEKASYADISEEKHVNSRLRLHALMHLPTDRPLMRITNAVSFERHEGDSGRLSDVHLGLGPSPVLGGTQHLVQGSYDYYHYMQDRMDDKGWGCAYRSLQTICSWFRHQNYTNVAVPDHRDIQQTLVRIGDKESSFIGSKNWIGALELSMCLDTLYGITCKIMTVSSGPQLADKGRELAHHFDANGTPIMIGGGVLAYTLLGVDYNDQTGDVAFLILDPHYVGAENIQVIQSKKWCGWHKADLFVKEAFYNLCMPQRPHLV